jgi:hypothetical protein
MKKEKTIVNTDEVMREMKKITGRLVRYGCFPGNDFIEDVEIVNVSQKDRLIKLTVVSAGWQDLKSYVEFEPVNDPLLAEKSRAVVAFLLKDTEETIICPSHGYKIHNWPDPE